MSASITSGQNAPAGTGPLSKAMAGLVPISGVVLDPSEGRIPGAAVTIDNQALDRQWSTTTDATGTFLFEGIQPGNYEIHVQHAGFNLSTVRVQASPHGSAPLRIVLTLAASKQEITVGITSGKVSAEPSENGDSIRLDRQVLDSLPILGNDIVGAVAAMIGPAWQGTRGVDVIVDGLPTSELQLPASVIEEVRINQNPYAAEFSAPGQNRIELFTKTGSAHYHGSFDSEFRDSNLDARDAFALVRPREEHRLYEGSLSGPVGRIRKLEFEATASRGESDLQSIVDAITTSGPIHQNFPNAHASTYLDAGLDWQLGKASTLSVRYGFYDWSDKGSGVGGFTLPEAASDVSIQRHYLKATSRAVISDNLINELSVRVTARKSLAQSEHSGEPSVEVLGAFTGGGAQVNQRQTRDSLELTDKISWSHGKHMLLAGVNIPALARWDLNDKTNFGGTFRFSSLEDYLQNRAFSYVRNMGDSRLIYWQEELGIFGQDDVRLRANLSVSLGLRYDWQNYVSNSKNFAPRIAFAFAPGKARKTVLRGGAGIFYETTGPEALADVSRYNGQSLRQIVLTNPSFPQPLSLGITGPTLPSSVVRFATDLRLPYTLQYRFALERQLSSSMTISATYIGSRGFDLFRSLDVNAPLPPLYVQRPDPAIATLRQIESTGRLESNSLRLAVHGKLSRYFSGMAQYTLGRSYEDTGGIDSFPANQYDLTGEWSRSDFDVRHSVYLYGTSDIAKYFDLGVGLSFDSGAPYTITTGADTYGTTFANARPRGVPRNSLQGPPFTTLDMRLVKEFSVPVHRAGKKDSPTVTIALDSFNILNHVNLGEPVGVLSSPFFGTSINADSARKLQLSLGIKF